MHKHILKVSSTASPMPHHEIKKSIESRMHQISNKGIQHNKRKDSKNYTNSTSLQTSTYTNSQIILK